MSTDQRSRIVVDVTQVNPVVRLVGEHDISTAGAVRRVVRETLPTTEALVVDLSEVTFIDASIARTLIELQETSEQAGARIEVTVPSESESLVRRLLFEILPHIGSRLYTGPNLKEALRSIDRWRAVHHRRTNSPW